MYVHISLNTSLNTILTMLNKNLSFVIWNIFIKKNQTINQTSEQTVIKQLIVESNQPNEFR